MTDASATVSAPSTEPLLAAILEVESLTHEELAKLIVGMRAKDAHQTALIQDLGATAVRLEGERNTAQADLRAAERERANLMASHVREVGGLQDRLMQAQIVAAEMRGRLSEARGNQMVRRGDLVPDNLRVYDDGVPF